MTTELLDRIVKPALEGMGCHFDELTEDAVGFQYRSSDGVPRRVRIVDQELGTPVFSVIIPDIVRFPPEQKGVALRLINRLNRTLVGKLVLDQDLDVMFELEACVSEKSGPEAFHDPFGYAAAGVKRVYPIIMRVRWGGQSIEEAMNSQSGTGEVDPAWKVIEGILKRSEDDSQESESTQ